MYNNIKDKNTPAHCDICQFWIHTKYNNINHIDYKYLQGSNNPCFCISCCNEIFPSESLTNENLFMMQVNSTPTSTEVKTVMLLV